MTTIGIIGAGEVGRELARAAIGNGYQIAIANSKQPETLTALVKELGPAARAMYARDVAAQADFAVLAFPYRPADRLPVDELAGKIVLDTNNYMVWRDGHYPEVDTGRKTVHELRQEQLPASKIAKAFTHIQAPSLLRFGRPPGTPGRMALAVSSDHADAVELVRRLYDEFGFDTVDNSPLSKSWRSAPGTPMWEYHAIGQTREQLIRNLAQAHR